MAWDSPNRCEAPTTLRGIKGRQCAQTAMNGSHFCWYHQPDRPRKFGQGYLQEALAERHTQPEGDPA